LDRLQGAAWSSVRRAIDGLAEDPHRGNVRPLQGKDWKGYFRKRAGDFRIVFTLDPAARAVTVHAVLRKSEKTYR
jgi:mRNA-degrading endonuclease RelE of RelBE toxin-antitoxin system